MIFIDAGDQEILEHREHHGLTHVQWDPTGRYVVSAVNRPGVSACMPVYCLFCHSAQHVRRRTTASTCTPSRAKYCKSMCLSACMRSAGAHAPQACSTRPKLMCVCLCVSVLVLSVGHAVRFQSLRCQPPLTGNVQKIKKNLKTYQSEFEAQDVMQQSRTSDEQKKKRRDLLKLWEDYETSIAKATESRRARMAKMRAGTSLCPGFPLLPLVRWVVTRCACSWFVFFSLRSHACRCAASGPTEAGGARGACGAAHQGGHHHCRSRGLSAVVACFGVGCCCVGMICTEVTVSRMVR
jgi:hypothetical protein